MGKSFIIGMSALLLLGSCDTYTGSGIYMGSSLGSIFGSAIGGIAGGLAAATWAPWWAWLAVPWLARR